MQYFWFFDGMALGRHRISHTHSPSSVTHPHTHTQTHTHTHTHTHTPTHTTIVEYNLVSFFFLSAYPSRSASGYGRQASSASATAVSSSSVGTPLGGNMSCRNDIWKVVSFLMFFLVTAAGHVSAPTAPTNYQPVLAQRECCNLIIYTLPHPPAYTILTFLIALLTLLQWLVYNLDLIT